MESKQIKKIGSAMEILERLDKGLIPDEELRELVKIQWGRRLKWGYKSTHVQQLEFNLDFVKSLKQMDMSGKMEVINSESYELPVAFLRAMFGKTLKQSCCYFEDESMTLDEAETAAHELYCERAQIKDGQRVLDIGCGQGSLIIHIAQKYKNCHVTGITNSNAQKNIIEEECRNLKLSNVEVILADVTQYDTKDTFDRIILIEAVEHMKNIDLFLKKISKWMKDDGLMFIDCICHKTFGHHFEAIDEDDWYSGYIFPKGSVTLQAASTLLYFQEDVAVVDQWAVSGKHMARTVEEWLKKLDKNIDVAREILEPSLGSKEAVEKVITHSRTFCIGTSEQFSYNNGDEWMISHVLFKKK
nr:putative N-methyltransferase [synthetic construct]